MHITTATSISAYMDLLATRSAPLPPPPPPPPPKRTPAAASGALTGLFHELFFLVTSELLMSDV